MVYQVSRVIFLILVLGGSAVAAENKNWSFGGNYRLRYENLDNPFRANIEDSDQVLASRLLASVKFNNDGVFGEFELQDSRTWLDDDSTPLGTDDVNPLEPLQVYIGWRNKNNFSAKVGRLTLNIGSRRLVSRNGFRNTINAFSGMHTSWIKDNWHVQTLYTLPLQRRPSDRLALDNNEIQIDKHYSGIHFAGIHVTREKQNKELLELYYFMLDEEDQANLNTRNRALNTLGLRLLQPKKLSHWDYEFEAAYQFGEARTNRSVSNTNDLDVNAGFIHVHLAYQFNSLWFSRIVLQADYASGDKDPNDNKYNRFDTLFGSRGFEYGHTGIYGAFARSNILSPGLRWEFQPRDALSALVGYRSVWLASDKDALTTANVVDPSGNTSKFVGQQLQVRLDIKLSSSIKFEVGGAYLLKGSFLKDAPNASPTGDTHHIYSQVVVKF